jgi:hypothetical protein
VADICRKVCVSAFNFESSLFGLSGSSAFMLLFPLGE